jgi:hypothetical protein
VHLQALDHVEEPLCDWALLQKELVVHYWTQLGYRCRPVGVGVSPHRSCAWTWPHDVFCLDTRNSVRTLWACVLAQAVAEAAIHSHAGRSAPSRAVENGPGASLRLCACPRGGCSRHWQVTT